MPVWTRPPAARDCDLRSRERGEGGAPLPGGGRRRGRVRTRRFENTLWERTKSLRPAVHGVVLRGLTFARSPPSLRVPDPSGLSGERRLSVLPGSLGARTREAQTAGRAEAGRAARVLAVPRPERESRPRGFRNASSDRGLIRGSASVRPACGARAGGFTRRPLRYRNHDFLWREKRKK